MMWGWGYLGRVVEDLTRGPAAVAAREPLPPELIRLGLVVVIGIFMSILDTTIVNVALDTLGRDLGSPLSTIQWVTTGYLLAISLVIPVAGWATDRFGAKRLFLLSLVLFTGGSALCGIAWDATSLIGFRVLQGAGGALVMPVGQAILARAAGPARMNRMMSVIGVPALLGPVLGPVIGGLIVTHLSWRWIFFVNVPVGIIAVLLAVRVLPSDRARRVGSLDLRGLLLLSPALALLVYGLSEAGVQGSWTAARAWIPMVVGALFAVGFVLNALGRGERALVPVTYFRDRAFTGASVSTFVFALAIFGGMLLLPLYYQQVRGASALEAGLLMAPQGIGAAASMAVAGRLADRTGPRPVVLSGVALLILGTLAFTQLTPTSPYWLLVISLVVRGVGMGMAMMTAMSAAYRNLAASAVPNATTALNIFQRVGGSVGTALVSVLLVQSITRRGAPTPATLAAAFGETFWWVVALSVIPLFAALLLPNRPIENITGTASGWETAPAPDAPGVPAVPAAADTRAAARSDGDMAPDR
jgi:EmrB/QacA subfamily drug resistance transporter